MLLDIVHIQMQQISGWGHCNLLAKVKQRGKHDNCNVQYIGYTMRQLQWRLNEHKNQRQQPPADGSV